MSAATMIPEAPATPRITISSNGPRRPGWLSEAELAARWDRAPETLASWRTRPTLTRPTASFEMFGIYVYYSLVDVYRFEAVSSQASIRALALRGTPFPPLFTTHVQERLLESFEVMHALQLRDLADDVVAELLEAKWQEAGYHALHVCRAEAEAYRSLRAVAGESFEEAVADRTRELAEMEGTLDESDAQPELPLDPTWGKPCTVAAAAREFDRAESTEKIPMRSALANAIEALSRMSTPRIDRFTIVAGYALASDTRGGHWFAPVLGGNLDALTWKPITALPSIAPAGEVRS